MTVSWRTDALTVPAAVTLGPSAVHTHAGVLYQRSLDDAVRHLHLAWHHRLCDEAGLAGGVGWIEPTLPEDVIEDVAFLAELVAAREENGTVPYGLSLERAKVDDRGVVVLDGERGLTCATFVMIVIAKVGVSLLDRETWNTDPDDDRRAEDAAHQRSLVSYLRNTPGASQHAADVAREVGCTRFRAEEVAAATALSPRPVPYAIAEPAGRALLPRVKPITAPG
jgi:hypothetical protein